MFQPVIVSAGIAGWQFLQRTYDRQFEAFSQSPELKRDVDYFRENIGSITTGEALVSDRRLLTVALGAFGLESDINNRYFIQKMLDEGTTAEDSLANRFADSRYREFSEAFGFGPNEIPQTLLSNFADGVVARFESASFEIALGAQDESMRIALYAQRVLSDIVSQEDTTVDQKWFTVMSQPPLRSLFETALNLPSSFGQIDIDQQLEVFKDRASSQFGSEDLSNFADADALDELVRTYVARAQLASFSTGQSSGSIALTLLQNSQV